MKQVLPTIALCLLAHTLFSQQGPLLQKFKYRISNFQGFSYSIGGNSGYDKYNAGSDEHEHSSVSGSMGANYFKIKSTDKILLSASGSLFSSYSGSKAILPGEVNTNKNFNLNPSVNVLNKWFAENHFTELGATAYSSYSSYKHPDSSPYGTEKNSQHYYSVAFNTGIGKGRLENVTDMQSGLWLYKELKDANLLTRSLSDDELLELGQYVTRGSNTRVLDGRRRTQFVLKTVDAFFQQKELIAKTDINYFSRLNDLLFFAVNNQRLSGTEKFIRFTPAISGNIQHSTPSNAVDKFKQADISKSLLLSSGFNKYIPVSLTQQNNYGAAIKLAYIDRAYSTKDFVGGVTSTGESNWNIKQAGVNVFFQHAIYPNTRTTILFDFQSQGGYQESGSSSQFYGSAGITGVMNYFVSYRTMLHCDIGASYEKNMYYSVPTFTQPNRVLLNINVGLDVSL
jgi:hypothetical protein